MTTTNKPSVAFWIISVLALIWNAMGVDAYIQQVYKTDRFTAMYSPEQLEIINNEPAWLTGVFAVAVFAGALGCLFLLLRKKISKSLFMLSLLAVLIQTVYALMHKEMMQYYGAFEYSMFILIPLIDIFLVWYAKYTIKKGWVA